MKLGVISDTHGVLRPDVTEKLTGCDRILHAGDIDREDVLESLMDIAPVLAVRGNNDWGRWADKLPRQRRFELDGVRFLMVHNRMDAPYKLDGVDVVVFGHTHRFALDSLEGRLWLNPGSCGWPRFGQGLSIALLTLEGGRPHVERVDLENPPERRRRWYG